MQYCLDTNTCIDAMKGRSPDLAKRFSAHSPDDIAIPAIVRAELLLGALKTREPEKTAQTVEAFLAPYVVLSFDKAAAQHYASIRHHLERTGRIIGPNDLIIAATARSHRLTLVTHNTDEFGRVSGLLLEDWTGL
jgi:tRNA(fMet)-specific endonuclease VapC